MALELVGEHCGTDVLDIHAGGVDLIFPHHEDEIAQSCAYTGEARFARYWLHGEFLNIRGDKMSKRFGNITTARDLREDGVDAGAVRLLVFQTHYRQKLDLTDEALAARGRARAGWASSSDRLLAARAGAERRRSPRPRDRLQRELTEALDDDLNAPRAVAALFDFVREATGAGRGRGPGPARRWRPGSGRRGPGRRPAVR